MGIDFLKLIDDFLSTSEVSESKKTSHKKKEKSFNELASIFPEGTLNSASAESAQINIPLSKPLEINEKAEQKRLEKVVEIEHNKLGSAAGEYFKAMTEGKETEEQAQRYFDALSEYSDVAMQKYNFDGDIKNITQDEYIEQNKVGKVKDDPEITQRLITGAKNLFEADDFNEDGVVDKAEFAFRINNVFHEYNDNVNKVMAKEDGKSVTSQLYLLHGNDFKNYEKSVYERVKKEIDERSQ